MFIASKGVVLSIYYFGVVDCGIKWDLTFEYFENTQVNKGKLFQTVEIVYDCLADLECSLLYCI